MPSPPPENPVPSLPPVKRYALYGAALGMLAGLLYLAGTSAAPQREVVIWRNFILAGCFIGLLCGAGVAFVAHRKKSPPGGDKPAE